MKRFVFIGVLAFTLFVFMAPVRAEAQFIKEYTVHLAYILKSSPNERRYERTTTDTIRAANEFVARTNMTLRYANMSNIRNTSIRIIRIHLREEWCDQRCPDSF